MNTRSTTESELVGVSKYLQYPLWQIIFWKEQGYDIKRNVVYQDNESTIRMEKMAEIHVPVTCGTYQ